LRCIYSRYLCLNVSISDRGYLFSDERCLFQPLCEQVGILNMMTYDYIVLGGGIIGMMTARELASRGASVAIFDRNELGMETSWAAGGILSSMRPWAEHPASAELSEQGKILYPK